MTTVKKWEILHIPDRPSTLNNQQPTVEVIASTIEPKFTHTLVRRLNQIVPLENLRHVKRVQKKNSVEAGKVQLSVILCLANDNDNQLGNIPNDVLELVNSYKLSPFITKVAKYAPSTKEDWEEQCKLWPTSYHPPTFNIDGITGFNDEDTQAIFNFMKLTVALTKSGPQVVNAAVIVDPSVRQVISSAIDQTCSSGTQTDNNNFETDLAKQQEASATHQSGADGEISDTLPSVCALDEHKRLYTSVSCLYPWKWVEQRFSSATMCSWHPLGHAAFVAIEYAAARDRSLFPGPGHSQGDFTQEDHLLSTSTSLPTKRQKLYVSNDEADTVSNGCPSGFGSEVVRPYLCTGFDIYLAWEPCTMCAMALVHQRIRRIFYAFPNPNLGALGSVQRLQGEQSLNHHYAVFRVMLPSEVLDEVTSDCNC